MFETLNTIDWSHAQSCYGTSEGITAAIRGLVSAEASVRDRARETLWMSLEHQGSVYEGSALAVPFLLAILADPQTQDKGQLVHFLAHLGCRGLYLGHWYENLQTRLVLQRMKEDKTVFSQGARDRDRRWEEDTHQGFREGLHIFLPLLSDPDPAIREAVAFLLATFPEDRSSLLPPLITQLQSFANGLKKDYDAVKAGLTLEWSQGQVEGQVHRLKLLKRQMYGRGRFDLLRKRVLKRA